MTKTTWILFGIVAIALWAVAKQIRGLHAWQDYYGTKVGATPQPWHWNPLR
jgi:hypothetical protein